MKLKKVNILFVILEILSVALGAGLVSGMWYMILILFFGLFIGILFELINNKILKNVLLILNFSFGVIFFIFAWFYILMSQYSFSSLDPILIDFIRLLFISMVKIFSPISSIKFKKKSTELVSN